jgi:ectoine hydroxylase-related dioxygenase (phytanoyl-CoA dioxygenase family)
MEKKAYNQYTHHPSNGEMIMFPGWVTHAVLHNKTDRERVALTSNIRLKNEHEVF